MGLYKNDNGTLTPIAGKGKAGFGISEFRSGTATVGAIAANGYATTTVVFDKPMPDNNYIICIQHVSSAWLYWDAYNPTVNGFTLYLVDGHGAATSSATAKWYAFKPYTDIEYDNLTALTNYSTTEQLVGTWIDGKPLYQLTFTMKTPSTLNTTTTYNLSAYNIDKIISEDAMLQRTTNDIDHVVNWHYANNDHDMCTYFNFTNGLYYIYKRSGVSDMNANAFITLKYTKK